MASAGLLERPEPKNDVVRQLILSQCRLVGNEADTSLVRDMAFAERRAQLGVDQDLIEIIKAIAAKCMASSALCRYSDRKQPFIFAYNLLSMPSMRSRKLRADAERIRNEELFPLVSPDPLMWKVNVVLTVLGVDCEHPRYQADVGQAVRSALAASGGQGAQADDVELEFWGGGTMSAIIAPGAGGSAEALRDAVDGIPLSALSAAVAENCPKSVFAVGKVYVSEINEPPMLMSDRSHAIFKVCVHGAWLEQNTQDWDGAQSAAITGAAQGYKVSMAGDKKIVDTFTPLMGFEGHI